MNGEFAAVAVSAPRADVLETFDIHGDFSHEFPFEELPFDSRAQSRLLRLGERLSRHIQVDVQFPKNATRERSADPLEIREGDLHAFLAGKDDTSDAEHDEEVGLG